MKRDIVKQPSDSALEREIEAILGVDPSPGYVSRVRTRVASAPAPAAWRFGWTVLAAGTMAAAIIVALVLNWTHEVIPPTIPEKTSTTAMLPNTPLSKEPRTLNSSTVPVQKVKNISQHESSEPEMLISPDEASAMKRYMNRPPVQWVEIAVVSIEPQPLPELRVTPVPLLELNPELNKVEQSLPTVPKGELQ